MAGVIYYIRSAATGRTYVGSTTRGIKQRWSEHLHYLRKGTHHSRHLQRVYSKHGEDDLSVSAVYECRPGEDILAIEQQHIDLFKGRCMNGAPVSDSIYAAHAAARGRKVPDSERKRRSESAKRAIAEGRAKRGPWSDERKAAHSEQARKNISAGLRLMHAVNGTAAKPKAPDRRTAFIANEVESWRLMRAEGKSYREIERITGRCRRVIARECWERQE